jgi:methylmalonyl-CoA mutase N-terminal domain/subunit
MSDPLERVAREQARWETETLAPALAEAPESRTEFTTVSLRSTKRLYTPLDVAKIDPVSEIGFPGEYPFTRGVYPTMYRSRPWTMRQYSGFGTPEASNARYKYLLSQGQTGLSCAFDLPTLMGYDPDHPMARGEVGKCGVAISTLADMEVLFDGIPLSDITTSMTITSTACVVWAMFIAVCEKQGLPFDRIAGTLQNDILKEFIAQKEFLFPIAPSLRLVTDTVVFGSRQLPRWNTISISGYHIREAGATAVQELAFTLADGMTYVEEALKAGLDVDAFAPRLSFFFDLHNDFFEEIAKLRAARRLWSRIMRERFGAKDPRSWRLRTHAQTAGVSLTAQQPQNNIVRVAIQALAGVLGGTQSLHTNSMDEVLALPSEEAVTIALRTQQIIAHETGAANTIDPLGGSYFVEALTAELEAEAEAYFQRIEALGGMVKAIERGFPQQEIADSAYRFQRAVEAREKIIVGVNAHVTGAYPPIPILQIDEEVARRAVARLREVRRSRNSARVAETLGDLRRAAAGDEPLMPRILACVRAYASLGEIVDLFREVFGEYTEPTLF